MDNQPDKLKSMGTQSKETVDLAAAKTQDAVGSTRKAVDQTLDMAADKVDDAKDSASTVIDQASGVANAVAGKARDQFETVKAQVRVRVGTVSDQIADYTEAEPVKAMLIAAATGAVLMALLSMMASSRD